MLVASLARRRAAILVCAHSSSVSGRFFSKEGNGRQPRANKRKAVKEEKEVVSDGASVPSGQPSLFEQLFPDQREIEKAKPRHDDVPRLPIETITPPPPDRSGTLNREEARALHWSIPSRLVRQERAHNQAQAGTSVLVLRNASKNLVEEDFRRLIPQGKHLEGWKLDAGDIIGVIPGRDLNTLAQTGYYFLLFSTPLSAFTYQGRASRIHRMVSAHTPSSILSPIAPPPGYLIEGMDAHAVMETFTLVPPTQSLDLRQLKTPLTPVMQSIVDNNGYIALTRRQDRMPYEARLTLEGPQLSLSYLRHIFIESGRDRALGWSGGDDLVPKVTKWEPPPPEDIISPSSRSILSHRSAKYNYRRHIEAKKDVSEQKTQQPRRDPQPVYILGFHTERALQSFVHFWHRRPIEWQGVQRHEDEEDDLPPTANVEVLW